MEHEPSPKLRNTVGNSSGDMMYMVVMADLMQKRPASDRPLKIQPATQQKTLRGFCSRCACVAFAFSVAGVVSQITQFKT